MRRANHILLLLAVLETGCAGMAVRPQTPARDLSVADMLAVQEVTKDRYFVLVFGSETKPRLPRFTHTWSTVVKVTQLPGCAAPTIEAHTISWMPASLEIRPYSPHVEPATNLDLRQSLDETLKHHEQVALWGPYETWYGLYHRFVTQKSYLESGALGYQCTDAFGEAARLGNGSNCFHALSDTDPQFDRRQYPLLFYGQPAALNIVRQISDRPILIEPTQTHDWLIPALGLDHYPIVRRQYHGPVKEFSREAILEAMSQPPPRRRPLP